MPARAEPLRRLRESAANGVSVGELGRLLGRDGLGLLLVLCSLPLLQPLPLAGLSTPIGLLAAAAGLQLVRGADALPLPRFVESRRLEPVLVRRLLAGAERLMRVIGGVARPRWAGLARSPRLLGGCAVALGLLIALPVYIPFGNPLCAVPLAMIGAALVEDDGALALLGALGTLLSVAFHAAVAAVVWSGALTLLGRPLS